MAFVGLGFDRLSNTVKESDSIGSLFVEDLETTTLEDTKDYEFFAREMRAAQFARALKLMNGNNFVLDLPPINQSWTTLPYKVMPQIKPLNKPCEFDTSFSPPKRLKRPCAYSVAQIEEVDSFLCID